VKDSKDPAEIEAYLKAYPDGAFAPLARMRIERLKGTGASEAAEVEPAAQRQKAISDNAEAIFRSSHAVAAGNPSGDVTVVEFFDYNCGYCRRAMPDVLKLVDNDDKVRLVFKELPLFGDSSEAAAKGALAAHKQGKYFEMHQKLLSESGKADKEKVLRIANEIGLDVPRLEKDMEDHSVQEALDEARSLAQKLDVQGTPFYLIGNRILPGAPEDLYEQLTEKVAEVREMSAANASDASPPSVDDLDDLGDLDKLD